VEKGLLFISVENCLSFPHPPGDALSLYFQGFPAFSTVFVPYYDHYLKTDFLFFPNQKNDGKDLQA